MVVGYAAVDRGGEGMTELPWYVDSPPVRRWAANLQKAGKKEEVERRLALWAAMVEEYGVVNTRVEGKVGVIELSYPRKANALVPPMYKMLVRAVQDHDADPDVWAIVFTGAGKNFSSGGYVGHDAFYAGLDAGEDGVNPEPMRQTFWQMFLEVHRTVYNCETPTIAALKGLTAGDALDWVLATDIRTGTPDCELWFSNGFTGNTAYTGAAWILPRMVGLSKATELLLTAARITGEDALKLGLLTSVHPFDELESAALGIAERVTSLPPITLRLIKKELHRCLEIANYDAALDVLSMIEPIVQATEDHMDAERAVIEKRAPVVRGY
jgi:enoyl-CoA hydratase/carnithine racemase